MRIPDYAKRVARNNGYDTYGEYLVGTITDEKLDKKYTIQELLDEIQSSTNLNLSEIGNKIGVNSSRISRWRSGKLKIHEGKHVYALIGLLPEN